MYHIKKDKRSIQSSESIYAALVELAQEKSFDDISITEIVSRAEVGRATFYRNFDCIDDVIRFKLDKNLEKVWEITQQAYQNGNMPVMISNSYTLKPILNYLYENPILYKLIIEGNKQDLLKENFCSLVNQYWMSTWDESGTVPEAITENFDYFIEIHATMLLSVIIKWFNDGLELTPDELHKLINGLKTKGL